MMTESVHLDRLHKRFGLTPSEGHPLGEPERVHFRLLPW